MSRQTISKNKRALSVSNVLNYSPEIIPFSGTWKEAIGLPEKKGSWIIFGEGGSGKTSFCMQLGKYFCTLNRRVIYNSIEEGVSESIKKGYVRNAMCDVSGKFILLDREPVSDLWKRLKSRRSADVVFIDSLQYTGLKAIEYKRFVDEFPDKLFVWISHAKNSMPKGAIGEAVYYDANVCLFAKGFKVMVVKSRYGGSGEIVVNEQKMREYWKL